MLLEQPLWKLQTVGSAKLIFLYEEKLRDDAVVLKPGVAASFRKLYGVVQALVQLSWIRKVQALPGNQPLIGHGGGLAYFLFGAERSFLTPLREGLLDVQKRRCFYCTSELRDSSEVDHFIPWSRYPRDLGHNFVVAHRRCNAGKRDFLADVPHLAVWRERNETHDRELQQIFSGVRILHD
ncbi:MAG: HNH endonuclease [Betaproteobacteria bacterium]